MTSMEIVEEFKSMEERIRSCYDGNVPYDEEILACIIARDAAFLVECLRMDRNPFDSHPIFGIKPGFELGGIVLDAFKLENQIPFFVLEKVLSMELRSEQEANRILGDSVKMCCGDLFSVPWKDMHLPSDPPANSMLEILYNVVVGEEIKSTSAGNGSWIPDSVCNYFHRILKCFQSNDAAGGGRRKRDKEAENVDGNNELTGSVEPRRRAGFTSVVNMVPREMPEKAVTKIKTLEKTVLPCAAQLEKEGVKFKAFEGGLGNIRFENRSTTLFLPLIFVEEKSGIPLRNLAAFEMSMRIKKRLPINGYVSLMDELIHNETDVAVMRKHGIIKSKMGSDTLIAELFHSIGRSSIPYPDERIDACREGLLEYLDIKWRTLVHEFLEANCSKPWLVISGLAATALMVMTLLQVVCLFTTCNPKGP